MKKVLTYFAAALTLFSCARETGVVEMREDIRFDLSVAVASGSGTKGSVIQDPNGSPGEAQMNENYISTVDIFFYLYGAAETDAAIYHLYEEQANSELRWTVSEGVDHAFLQAIFGNALADGSKCLVYTVVNYSPSTGSSFADNASRSVIRQSVKDSEFNRVDVNGDGIPQESFVMEGATEIQLSVQSGLYYVSGTIPVYRSASKMRLEVTVPDEIVNDGVEDGNGFVWKPLPDQMQAALVHGVRKGIVCAMDEEYQYDFSQSNNYFAEAADQHLWDNYGHRLVESGYKTRDVGGVETTIGKKYEHVTPMYSYPTLDWKNTPENETYITLVLPWRREDMTDEYKLTYYQIPIAVNPSDPTYQLKHNRYYRMEVEVGILGSFELEDKIQLFPSTYIILDWCINKDDNPAVAPVTMSQTAYLAVASHVDTLNNVNSHRVEYASSHDVTVTVEKIQYLDYMDKQVRLAQIVPSQPNRISYYTNFTLNADGSYTVSGTPTNVTSNGIYNTYSATTVTDPETNSTFVQFSHEIDPNSMYSTVNVFVSVSNGVVEDDSILFTQHPPIRIEAHQSNGYAFENTLDNSVARSNVYTSNNIQIGTLTERSSAASLTATGNNTNPNIYTIRISSFSQGSTYIVGDPRVTTPDNNMGQTDASWSEQPAYSTSYVAGGTYGTYYFDYNYYLLNQDLVNRNVSNTTQGVTGGPGRNNWGNYTSEATAYAGTNNYYYWRDGNTYRRARYYITGYKYYLPGSGLTNYYPTNPDGTADMIAPEIVIASSYGKTSSPYMTLERAAMRCALYQEDGYPAGRWRLPTYSEVKFIMELSTAGKIPTLFNMSANDSEGYWCANGRVITVNNVVQLQSPPSATLTAPRCVYDLWYWGEEHSTYATTWHLGDND